MSIDLNLLPIVTHAFQINNQEFQIFICCSKPNIPQSQNLIIFLPKEIKKSNTPLVKNVFF